MAYRTEIHKITLDIPERCPDAGARVMAELTKYKAAYSYVSYRTQDKYRVQVNISNIDAFNSYSIDYIAACVQYDVTCRQPDKGGTLGYINPPLELFIRMADPLVYKLCDRFHMQWPQSDVDDLRQSCRLTIVRLYNKGMYLHPRLIARVFYNDMMMEYRKNPIRTDIDSLDKIAYGDGDDLEITIGDQLDDPAAEEQIDKIIENAATMWAFDKVRTVIINRFGQRAYEQLLREYGSFGRTTEMGRKRMQDLKKLLNKLGLTPEWYRRNT